MGKVNKLRQKVKNAGIKKPAKPIKVPEESEPSSDDQSISDSDDDTYQNVRNKPLIKFGTRNNNNNNKNKTLANATDDKKIALVNRRPINKKEKLKTKHNMLLQKIKKMDQEKKKLLEKVKREKTVITGDMNPLKDALPSLDSLLKLKPNRDAIKTGIGNVHETKQPLIALRAGDDGGVKKVSKKVKKEMKRHKIKKLAKEYKQKFHHFQQVLKHDDFKQNPREAVAAHIRLTMQNT